MNIRLSYSIISLWLAGDYEGAIQALRGVWREPTDAMKYGSEKHKEWELEVQETGNLPAIFGGSPLKTAATEVKREMKILPWLTLVGIADLIHDTGRNTIVDYKTGHGSASQYATSTQHKIYKLLFPQGEVFEYMHYNQYTRVSTLQRIHLTPAIKEEALEIVVTVACDIRATLEQMEGK